jgi:hypothetical protein
VPNEIGDFYWPIAIRRRHISQNIFAFCVRNRAIVGFPFTWRPVKNEKKNPELRDSETAK